MLRPVFVAALLVAFFAALFATLLGLGAVAHAAAPAGSTRDPHAGAVLDLCVLGERSDGTASVRQRALVLGPAGFERLDRDPMLRQIDAAGHARQAFLSGLPLDRLAQVVTTMPPDPAWLARERLSVAEISTYLATAWGPAIAGGAERAPQERALAAYAAGCADWLLVPVIDWASWSWQWFDPPTNKLSLLLDGPPVPPDGTSPLMRGTAMLLPDIAFTGRIGAYHREGDSFVRVAVVSGGSERDVGMPDYPPADWGSGVPEFMSAIPDASCAIGAPRDGAPGLRCGPGVLDGAFLSKGTNEFSAGVCRARNLNNPEVWIACIARLEAEKVAGGAQKKLRQLRGLNLFAELRERGGEPSVRIGRREGVKVGYGFYLPDERGGMASYFKVTEAGPGGTGGELAPSILKNRFGPTPIGARVYEYPHSNLYLAPRLEGGILTGMSGPSTGSFGQEVVFPSWAAGVGLGAAWDFSGTVGSPEWRTMAEIHLLGATTSSARLGLLLIDWPSIEKGFYVAPRLKAFASVALAWGWVWASTAESVIDTVNGDYAEGRLFGVSGVVGLEYMLDPDTLLRLDVSWRAHGAAQLSARTETDLDLETRGDHYDLLLLRLGVELTR